MRLDTIEMRGGRVKIAVLGLGYVGITATACLASQGHHVIGVDPNATKVDIIMDGRSPITEPGVEERIGHGRRSGLITAQTFLDRRIADADLIFVCVGTPSAVDGSHNMTHIAEVSRQLAELVKAHPNSSPTIVFRSTMRPGSIDELITPIVRSVAGDDDARRMELVYNPEFLRESSAIEDFFAPPKIVIGTETGAPCAKLDELNKDIDAPVFYVKYRESEMTKFVDNSFHALKTAFANEIGRLCVKLGISAQAVNDIFLADTKLNISARYLKPGGAFGGSCLPKDVRALQHIGRTSAGFTHLIDALIVSNEAHKTFLFDYVARDLRHGASVLMLGIAFKDRSDDLRESPNVDLARMLITAGYQLSILDPYVEPQNLIGQNLGVLSNSPFIRDLLIDSEHAERIEWDLVIDTRGHADSYYLKALKTININRLV